MEFSADLDAHPAHGIYSIHRLLKAESRPLIAFG
jgi:hypothetical protein